MTINQITKLYNDFKEREFEAFKNHAIIMGAKFKDDDFLKPPSADDEEKIQPDETPTLFGEPEAYAHLTEQERREMTKRMKFRHQNWDLLKG